VSAPVCLGDSATFVLANPGDYTGVNFTYEWFHNGTPVGPNNDTLTIDPVSFADSGNYVMVITVDGCSDTTATPLNFVVNPLPAAFTPTFNTPCENDTLILFANPPTADPFTYSWAGPNSFVSASQDPVIAPAGLGDAGIYNITITDQNTCTATSAVTVTIKPTPAQPFIDYNDPLCLDDVLILTDTVTHSGSLEFIWTNPNGAADTTTLPQYTVSNAVAGLYTLVVVENGCISPSDDETIVYEPAPDAFDDAFSMAFRDSIFGMNVTLNDAVRAGYSISIVDSTNNGTLTLNNQGTFDYRPGFIFHGLDTFVYEICDPVCPTTCDSAMVVIDVQLDQRCFIPNGLSPNGDGINDFLVVVCREDYPNMQIQIFSRWGNRVYEGDPNGWNGQFNGKDLPDAAYFYVLDYGDGSEPETGYIIINR
jgi:gliding motility-associated-like protein